MRGCYYAAHEMIHWDWLTWGKTPSVPHSQQMDLKSTWIGLELALGIFNHWYVLYMYIYVHIIIVDISAIVSVCWACMIVPWRLCVSTLTVLTTLVVLMVNMLLLVHLMEHCLCGRPSLELTRILSNTGNVLVHMYVPDWYRKIATNLPSSKFSRILFTKWLFY